MSEHTIHEDASMRGPELHELHLEATHERFANYHDWQLYMSNSDSPQIYVDFGWYFAISAALARRVWVGSTERPLYPNMYMLLIGPPGIGKGLVLTSVKSLLKEPKMPGQFVETPTGPEPVTLLPIGADTTTFEALLADMSKSVRSKRWTDPVTKRGHVYAHISYTLLLEELSSMIKLKAADMSKLLLRLFDANDYDYRLKNGASAILRNVCMGMLAGTTTSFLEEAAKQSLFDDGFTARCIMLFGNARRMERFDLGTYSDSQLEAKKRLVKWLARLMDLYGGVTMAPEVMEYLEHWYRTEFVAEEKAAHPKMLAYYGRKRAHLLKLSMAMHFSEKLTMQLDVEDIMRAQAFLKEAEKQMRNGLLQAGRNALHAISGRVLRYLWRQNPRPVPETELMREFGAEVRMGELQEMLVTMLAQGFVERSQGGFGYLATNLGYARFVMSA